MKKEHNQDQNDVRKECLMNKDIGDLLLGGVAVFWAAAAVLATVRERGGWPFSHYDANHPIRILRAIRFKNKKPSSTTGNEPEP